jgi:hypothetical protein
MHVIKQTFKIVLNHKYSIFALLFTQAHIFEENKKKKLWVGTEIYTLLPFQWYMI